MLRQADGDGPSALLSEERLRLIFKDFCIRRPERSPKPASDFWGSPRGGWVFRVKTLRRAPFGGIVSRDAAHTCVPCTCQSAVPAAVLGTRREALRLGSSSAKPLASLPPRTCTSPERVLGTAPARLGLDAGSLLGDGVLCTLLALTWLMH